MALLTGIRVLDFGRFIAGPYCAALLGDLGADVIRIERVEGGEDRFVPPVADTGEGGLYLQMNRNKRCLTLDLASPQGRQIVRQLVATADVVVANLPPATLTQLGLDHATLSALNPRLVLASVSAYGPGGPYSERPGFDSIGQAMSGAMFMSGLPDAPARAAVPYVDVSTAQALAMGTLAALWARERSGRGQQVEGSLLRSSLVMGNAVLIEQALKAPDRVPQGNRGFTAAPSDLFRARDGWLVVATIGQADVRALVQADRPAGSGPRPALCRRRAARRPQPGHQRTDGRVVRRRAAATRCCRRWLRPRSRPRRC